MTSTTTTPLAAALEALEELDAAEDAAHDHAEARADEQRWAEERVWP